MLVVSRRNFGFRIWDFGLASPNRVGNPQSAIRNPKSRAAISLTEVLISMGILTLGLLGVASLFPVGGYYMQKAETADSASMIAQSVMSEIVTRGMLNPRTWFAMTPNKVGGSPPITDPNFILYGADGRYTTRGITNPPTPGFTRPLVETLAASKRNLALATPALSPTAKATALSSQFGNSYVIDPMWCAALTPTPSENIANRRGYAFPAAAIDVFPGSTHGYYTNPAWLTWKSSSVGVNSKLSWPIRRVTFRQPSTGWNLDSANSEALCRSTDDLSVDLPARADRPASQMWDISNGTPMARQWKGDYSWIATVTPTNCAARDMMATSPESVEATVSVVVLYKRGLPAPISNTGENNEAVMPERNVSASVISTGLSGGELLLRDPSTASANAFTNLKAGNWIMLCGPHPNTSPEDPKFFMNWYQVLSIDKEVGSVITDSNMQRLVTVRGPEWPWQPKSPWSNYSYLSNDLCVGIIKGAVAVHTKTLRLESASSAGAAPLGMTGGPNTNGVTEQTF